MNKNSTHFSFSVNLKNLSKEAHPITIEKQYLIIIY